MPPISYQGPLEKHEKPENMRSQTTESNLGVGQPGLTIAAILGDKGDDVYTAAPHTKIMEVVAELTRLRVGALVVVDSSNEPVGIISERDIVNHVGHKGLAIFESSVEDIMTLHPKTCAPDDKVETIMKRMTEGRFRHMPVIANGKLRGLVSIGDIVHHRMMEIEYENLKIKQAIVG